MYKQIANQIFILTKTTNHKIFSTYFFKHELHKHTKVKATHKANLHKIKIGVVENVCLANAHHDLLRRRCLCCGKNGTYTRYGWFSQQFYLSNYN